MTGTSLLTQRLGFSDTLGAFLAGVLLAETNYRSQARGDGRAQAYSVHLPILCLNHNPQLKTP